MKNKTGIRFALRISIGFIAALVAVLSGKLHATETIVAPVGEYHVPVPVGTSAWVYGLVTEEKWRGKMEYYYGPGDLSHPLSTLWMAGPEITGDFTQERYYLEVLDGTWAGLVLDIHSFIPQNRGIVIYGDASWKGFHLEYGSTMIVRAHATLGTMFPGETSGIRAGSDLIMVATHVDDGDGGTYQEEHVFMHNGSYWEDGASGAPADNVVVYPGQGFLVSIGGGPT